MRGFRLVIGSSGKKIFFQMLKKLRLNLFTGLETYGKFGLKHEKSINKILSRVQNAQKKGFI